MAFPDFAAAAETDRKPGSHVFVQCLPKMGSTALSRSLSNAAHEVDMDGAPLLMQQWLDTHASEWRSSLRCVVTDTHTALPTRANSSHFSDAFKCRFDQLIRPMPGLMVSGERHQAFQQELRSKLLAMPDSAT